MTSIASITAQEVELIGRFVELLAQEQSALVQGKTDALSDLAAKKQPLVEQLNAREYERRSALGIDAEHKTREAMRDWLRTNPSEDIAANWDAILTLAKQARQLHDQNASLVAMRLQQTTDALAILNLNRPFAQHSLYGSDGQASTSSGSRLVDSA